MKQNIRKLICGMALPAILTGLLLTGCGTNPSSGQVNKITVSYVEAPLNVPSILEKQKNLFQAEFKPTPVEWVNLTTGPQQTQALASGDLNFAHAIGSPSVLLAASEGLDLKIVGVYSRGPKSFMILTKNKAIHSIADLKGKKVGGPKGTVLQQLLVAALETKNLTQKDVDFISMDIPSAAAALENGSIDAALLAGAPALKAMDAGAKVLRDGQGLVDGTILTVVTKDFYNHHKDLVERFMKVQNNAVAYMLKNKQEVLAMSAKEIGLTKAQTEALYSWYDFTTTIRPADVKDLENTQAFLLQNGLQNKSVDIQALI